MYLSIFGHTIMRRNLHSSASLWALIAAAWTIVPWICCSPCCCLVGAAWSLPTLSRRQALVKTASGMVSLSVPAATAATAAAASSAAAATAATTIFSTSAYGRQEYTNAIAASRDTNISPAEAYDVIRQQVPAVSATATNGAHHRVKVVDVGAGAGVSTAILWNLGYRDIYAVDWSRTAWDAAVQLPLPASVRFFGLDDAAFFQRASAAAANNEEAMPDKFHVIVYNFAINLDKAKQIARRHLVESETTDSPTSPSLLLAPINDTVDYWYKQSYVVLNARGQVVWQSDTAIGAWSVQFQPDVTSNTCTGIWCGAFNGYQKSL
jgi:hypothetical protein